MPTKVMISPFLPLPGDGELPQALQYEPGREYVLVVASNDAEWKQLITKLGLCKVRRGGYKIDSEFDSPGIERVIDAERLLNLLADSNPE